MTERLYLIDSYITEFNALVLDQSKTDRGFALILDKTYFYPTSGGQPHDLGLVNGIPVLEVYAHPHEDSIVHIVAGEISSEYIEASIDWERRFDHMQQHTGQHILSQAFIQVVGVQTLSFHLGGEFSTIDLEVPMLSQEQIDKAELLANKIIWENRLVKSRFISRDLQDSLPLRKIPEVNGGHLRIVEIEDFDISACGGTHVSTTGEVGIIKITRNERRGDTIRLEFVCGRRALKDYAAKNVIMNRLASKLTTGYWQIEDTVDRLREEAKTSRQALKKQTKQILALEAIALLQEATAFNMTRIVTKVFQDRNPADIRVLAGLIVQRPHHVALLGQAGSKSQIILATSEDLPLGMNQVLSQVLPLIGDTTGGGSGTFAQGGGSAAEVAVVQNALKKAKKIIIQALEGISQGM